ncbi:MAG: hypothetical protein MI924_28515, partial [Chloroflexales bacterium]|nr:hypothetical protein [Chloroflexales bacterium]
TGRSRGSWTNLFGIGQHTRHPPAATQAFTSSTMPTWIRPPQRIVEHIALAIERLRVVWSPRAADLLPLLGAELEPERLPVLPVQGCGKAGLVEPNRQGFEGHTVHATAGAARHYGG